MVIKSPQRSAYPEPAAPDSRAAQEPDPRRLRAAFEAAPDGILIVDGDRLRFLDCNEAACRLFGCTREQLLELGPERLLAEPGPQLKAGWQALIQGKWSGNSVESSCASADGSPLLLEIRRHAVKIDNSWLIILTARDVSRHRPDERLYQREAARQALLARFGQFALENPPLAELRERAIEVIREGVGAELCRLLEAGPDDHTLVHTAGHGWEEGFVQARFFDAARETEDRFILGARELLVVQDYAHETRYLPSPIQQAHGIRSSVEVLMCGAGNTHGLIGAYAREPRSFDGEDANFLQNVANTLTASIERKAGEERLAYLARFDALTGLPNRTLYLEKLSDAMLTAEQEDTCCAVLFIDLDRFKTVNDTLGHAVGDALLVEVAERLCRCVRAGDTVGRLSGDEFAVVLADIGHPEGAAATARKLNAELARPFEIAGQTVYISGSIGISLFPRDGGEPDTLLKHADQAMYAVKKGERNTFKFALPHTHESALIQLHMESDLRGALDRAEYSVHYQPRVDLASGAVCGLEALLRWHNPTRGSVSPDDFIPILEDTGLIVRVGEWVLSSVCRQVRSWLSAGLQVPPVAVNLSAVQFHQPGLPVAIRRIVTQSGIDPGLIEFELTESALMSDLSACVEKLEQIRICGHRLSVDDFGTGYSSLSYLRRFPIDALKIDRSFVRDLSTGPEAGVLVLAIINLAHSLKLRVVAEGIETEDQLAFVRRNGCDEVQGYLIAHPMPSEAIDRLLRDRQGFSATGSFRQLQPALRLR